MNKTPQTNKKLKLKRIHKKKTTKNHINIKNNQCKTYNKMKAKGCKQ